MNKINIEWRYIFFSLLVIYGTMIQQAYANSSATPDVETLQFPQLIINEVSFKNSQQDWIELYVVNDQNKGRGGSIEGLQIQDDSVFFTVEEDVTVKTGDYLIVYFKESDGKIFRGNDLLTIHTTRSGLTGTTEQVVIKNQKNEILDAVCWKNDSPTQSEVEDFEEIKDEIHDCVNSEEINAGESIGRTDFIDTNTKNDWTVFTNPSPGTSPPVIVEEVLDNDEDELPDADLEEETITEEIDTCLSNIFINEIFPNPEGKDTGIEWIELFNPGDKTCILNGLLIDDREGSSKPCALKENHIITNNGFILLPSWETKINLNNDEDFVRLLFEDGTVQDEIKYEKASENESYAKTANEEFIWTKIYTPLLPNIISTEETEEEETGKKANSEIKKATIQNGSLSDKIQISEIFPNPKGTDKGNEWIEIYNNSNDTVKLGNWYIDAGQESTKKYIFENNNFESGKYITISDTDLGFSLKNSAGGLRLLDYEDNVVDEVEYESSFENESFMRTTIFENNEEENNDWRWTKNPSPGEKNLTLYRYEGEILEFDKITGKLSINVENNILSIGVVEGGDILVSELFTEGSMIEAVVSTDTDGNLLLEEYEILQITEAHNDKQDGLLYILLSSLPPIGFMGYLGIKKLGLIKIIS